MVSDERQLKGESATVAILSREEDMRELDSFAQTCLVKFNRENLKDSMRQKWGRLFLEAKSVKANVRSYEDLEERIRLLEEKK